jgi:uncharacterized iron-regulated membrane protein
MKRDLCSGCHRKWSRQQLRSSATFRRGLPVKATLWNYRDVAGIWCGLPLFLVALTGLIMSYGWANNALYQLTRSQPSLRGTASRSSEAMQFVEQIRNANHYRRFLTARRTM